MVSEAVLPPFSLHRSNAIGTSVPKESATPQAVQTNPATAVRDRCGWALEGVALAVLVLLRVVYACVYRVDSDEPQHLHVVWGWAHGLLQYRDIFDNHSPLFQALCAPYFRLFGEHAWILLPMRLAMLPLYLADLWFVFAIGRSLYTRQWGRWAALIAGAVPIFFLVTTEFRTDDLWTTLWLGSLWLAIRAPAPGAPGRARHAFILGLTMGACFATSMKTTLLLLSLGISTGGVALLHGLSRRQGYLAAALRDAGLFFAGLIIIPGLIIAFFAAHGSLHQMYYCVIQHNTVPGLGKWAKAGFHLWLFPIALPLLIALGWLCMHSSADDRIGSGRALILITAGAYYFLLRSYWPLVTAQDFTPVWPLIVLSALPLLFHLLSLPRSAILIPAAGALLLALEIGLIGKAQSPLSNQMRPFVQDLDAVLRLTTPADYVMDGKGETIFRKRPIYWVLEGVTLKRIQLGLIPDEVRKRMIATRTCVAVNHRLREVDRDWLRANYIEGGGKVWVAGQYLGPARPAISFHTDFPAAYSFVSSTPGGAPALACTLDGSPLQPSRQIPAGNHQLELTTPAGAIAMVWTPALERGFHPFSKAVDSAEEAQP